MAPTSGVPIRVWTVGLDSLNQRLMTRVRALLGDVIRERREQLGFTQEGFAHHARLARTYYGRIERGEQNLTIERLVLLAGYLKTSVPELTQRLTREVCRDLIEAAASEES